MESPDTIKTTVTQIDIDYGYKNNHSFCPVALSLKRSNKHVSVRTAESHINKTYYKNSRRLKKFIKDFDEGKKVKPATFILKKSKQIFTYYPPLCLACKGINTNEK